MVGLACRMEGRPGAGIAGAALAGVVFLRRRHLDVARFADAIAPGLLVAQAIGRVGNRRVRRLGRVDASQRLPACLRALPESPGTSQAVEAPAPSVASQSLRHAVGDIEALAVPSGLVLDPLIALCLLASNNFLRAFDASIYKALKR